MIKHIVCWKLKPGYNLDSKEVFNMKKALEALPDLIEGLLHLEIGLDFSKQDSSQDIVLYSEFKSKEDLENYQSDSKHQEAALLVKEICEQRKLIDYEI